MGQQSTKYVGSTEDTFVATARHRLKKGNDRFMSSDYEGAKVQYRKALTTLQSMRKQQDGPLTNSLLNVKHADGMSIT